MPNLYIDPNDALLVNGRIVSAADLAEARQVLAHEGTGYVPGWSELTPTEQHDSIMSAAGYLEALARVAPPTGAGR